MDLVVVSAFPAYWSNQANLAFDWISDGSASSGETVNYRSITELLLSIDDDIQKTHVSLKSSILLPKYLAATDSNQRLMIVSTAWQVRGF